MSFRLLILTNNSTRASYRLRIGDHLEYLSQQGIQCDAQSLPSNVLQRWRLFKSSKNYDAVLIHRKCLNYWDALVLSRYCPKMIFDFDDAIMHSTSKPGSNHTSHYRLFRRTARMMDMMIAGNETLAEYAKKYCKQVFVLPTGLDVASYDMKDIPKSQDKIRLVWIGSKSTLGYLKQLRPVLEQVGQSYKNVVLRIIADDFFDLENMPVEKRQWSAQTQVSDLLECDIGISPLPDDRFARGKCGFKMLQYFAAGLPVIVSPVGVNEKFIRESNAGLLASTPEQWTDAIEQMVKDVESFRSSGENGKQYVQAFGRPVISREFCRILKSLFQ